LRNTRARCLKQLEAVRQAADDTDAAYLMRTRLRRALLTTARHVAEVDGAYAPEMPGIYEVRPDMSTLSIELVETCNRIYADSEALCQPSEALDMRWKNGWRAIQSDLAKLEALLRLEDAQERPGLAMSSIAS
jgi:hypothetical protein